MVGSTRLLDCRRVLRAHELFRFGGVDKVDEGLMHGGVHQVVTLLVVRQQVVRREDYTWHGAPTGHQVIGLAPSRLRD